MKVLVPTKLDNVAGLTWTEWPIESQGYPYPQSLVMLLPSWVRDGKTIHLKAQVTFKDGILSASLHREPGDTRIFGAFEIAFELWGAKGEDLEVTVAEPKGLAIFDGAGRWVPKAILPENIRVLVLFLDKNFRANWMGESPLVGLMLTGSFCPLSTLRVALWRLLSYRGMIRGVS